MVRIALALSLATSTAVCAVAEAQCPPNYVGSHLSTPGGSPIYASAHRDSSCLAPGACLWFAQWDLTTGDASCDAYTQCGGEVSPFGWVDQYTADDYVLSGPASPTPITFQAILHVTGSANTTCRPDCSQPGCPLVCSTGSASAYLKEGAQTSSYSLTGGPSADLTLTLSKGVGEPFRLDMYLHANAVCNGFGHATSHLTFALPPGYGVASCYGYAAPVATPASRLSWGRLKTVYR